MQETQETRVRSPGWEDPLQEEMAIHLHILAWEIPWDFPGWWEIMRVVTSTPSKATLLKDDSVPAVLMILTQQVWGEVCFWILNNFLGVIDADGLQKHILSNKDLGTRIQVEVVNIYEVTNRWRLKPQYFLTQSSGCDHIHCKGRILVMGPVCPLLLTLLSAPHGLARLLRMPAFVLWQISGYQ